MSSSEQEYRLQAADHRRTVRAHGITDAQAAARQYTGRRNMTFAERRDADGRAQESTHA